VSWVGFAAVFAVFFVTHSIPVRPAIKSRLVGVLGTGTFRLGYSIFSLASLTLLIWSAGEAPYVQVWSQLSWQRYVTVLGMLLVCLILSLSIGRPNPFSFGGARNDQFDPNRPGLVRWTRHPILLALALWAGVHLLSNGDVAHVILFGILGGFAIVGRGVIDRRTRRDLGQARWVALEAARRAAPILRAPISWASLGLRIAIGLGTFVGLLWAHPFVIGVSAL
jgi:uncharacterized membrane protein